MPTSCVLSVLPTSSVLPPSLVLAPMFVCNRNSSFLSLIIGGERWHCGDARNDQARNRDAFLDLAASTKGVKLVA